MHRRLPRPADPLATLTPAMRDALEAALKSLILTTRDGFARALAQADAPLCTAAALRALRDRGLFDRLEGGGFVLTRRGHRLARLSQHRRANLQRFLASRSRA